MDKDTTQYREFDRHHREGYLVETRSLNNVQDTLCVIKRIGSFTPLLSTAALLWAQIINNFFLITPSFLCTYLWKTHARRIFTPWSYVYIFLLSSSECPRHFYSQSSSFGLPKNGKKRRLFIAKIVESPGGVKNTIPSLNLFLEMENPEDAEE